MGWTSWFAFTPRYTRKIGISKSTLIFTNTRAQAELWFEALLKSQPELVGQIALHHGSLDKSIRRRVEEGLKLGEFNCVVCTSSLDLGVDFSPVEQVIQIGSQKGSPGFYKERVDRAIGQELRVKLFVLQPMP